MNNQTKRPDTLLRYWIYMIYGLVILTIVAAMNKAHATDVKALIQETALREGVNPDLALAIAQVESNLNPMAIGSMGEIGIFQLRPEYHSVVRGDVKKNVTTAIQYLARLQRKCSKYGDAFFVCFNYGPARHLKNPKQFPYYLKVVRQMDRNKHESNRFIATAD